MFVYLLQRFGDLNPRVKQGCIELLTTIENAYHRNPHSVLPYLVKPIPPKTGSNKDVLWRNIKARLDALHDAVKLFGLDDTPGDGETKKVLSGLSLEKSMAFSEPYLHHKNPEVRESAVKVIAELAVKIGDEAVAPYLHDVSPHLLEIIKDRIAELLGKGARQKQKKKHATPWKENVLADPESKDDVVQRLEEEVEKLKDMVEVGALLEPERGLSRGKRTGSRIGPASWPSNTRKRFAATDARSVNVEWCDKSCIASTPKIPPHHVEDTDDPDINWTMDKYGSNSFTEENLDLHYWRDCPVLCNCPLCNLIVEITTLTPHMLGECDNRGKVKACPRCREAIMAPEYAGHVARQSCYPASTIPGVTRCPLCHSDISSGDQGFKRHLLRGSGCPANLRKPPPTALRAAPGGGTPRTSAANGTGTPVRNSQTGGQQQHQQQGGKVRVAMTA
ncbi:hypothetical protein HK101_005812, partial [Irineochytrium annulatum]